MRKFFLVLILTSSLTTIAQKRVDIPKFYSMITPDNMVKSGEYYIEKGDTIWAHNRINPIPANLSIYQSDSSLMQYLESAFFTYDPCNKKNQNNRTIYQWKRQVIIFLDKSLSKDIRKRFIRHIENSYQGIPNLEVSITKKIEKGNLLFVTTNDSIGMLSEKSLSKQKLTRKYPLYDQVQAVAKTNQNNDMYFTKIELNVNKMSKDSIMHKLQQLLFLNLTVFQMNTKTPSTSMISWNYNYDPKISKFDKELLKIHYANLWVTKLHINDFLRIIERENICD